MPWIKVLHILFVIAWFAGLFNLPRLFVHHAQVAPAAQEQLLQLETRLYRFMHGCMLAALGFGVWLWRGAGFEGGWLQAKQLLVAGVVAYHCYCGKLLADFRHGRNQHSHIFYRIFNEALLLVLAGILILVVAKPF
ncbi:MAG TPA: CopD family protein [Polyangiaceae bacterium]|nr:CopD family protein [Polyangiaceae bacterium]